MLRDDEQKSYWEEVGTRREPGHPAVRAFADPKILRLRRLLPLESTMLEVGAGNGYLTWGLMQQYDLTVVDFSRNMLARNPAARDRKLIADVIALPFADESFDCVICANLLHHLSLPEQAVLEMKRVAASTVVLIEPNALNPAMFLFGLLKKEERGAVKFFPKYLRRLGAIASMRLRYFATHGSVLPNRTPMAALPVLSAIDFEQPFGFYNIAVFDVSSSSDGPASEECT